MTAGAVAAEVIRTVEAELAAARMEAGTFSDDPYTWHDRHSAAMDRLAERLAGKVGARVTVKWNGARVRLGGLAASSTGGLAGALENWLTAALRR